MLSILATILSWDDSEREKAGLQKVGKGKPAPMRRRSTKDVERSAEEEAAMNEVSFSPSTVDMWLIIVILEPVCRVLAQGVFAGTGKGIAVSSSWRSPFTRGKTFFVHIILTYEFWTNDSCSSQRANTSDVVSFKHIKYGAGPTTSDW
jgi:hypothetical protein